jgi:phage-related tail fiber protein
MAATYYIILTDIGAAKIAASQTGGAAVALSTIRVGDSNGAYYEPTSAQTALVNQVWSGAISTLVQDTLDPTTYTAETVIPATDGGFFIREAGLFDSVGDLIAIGKYPLIQKTVVADGAGEDVAIRFLIKVSSASNVTLSIDPSTVYATIAYVDGEINDVITLINGKVHNDFGGRDALATHPSESITYNATTVKLELDALNASVSSISYLNNQTYFIGGF